MHPKLWCSGDNQVIKEQPLAQCRASKHGCTQSFGVLVIKEQPLAQCRASITSVDPKLWCSGYNHVINLVRNPVNGTPRDNKSGHIHVLQASPSLCIIIYTYTIYRQLSPPHSMGFIESIKILHNYIVLRN